MINNILKLASDCESLAAYQNLNDNEKRLIDGAKNILDKNHIQKLLNNYKSDIKDEKLLKEYYIVQNVTAKFAPTILNNFPELMEARRAIARFMQQKSREKRKEDPELQENIKNYNARLSDQQKAIKEVAINEPEDINNIRTNLWHWTRKLDNQIATLKKNLKKKLSTKDILDSNNLMQEFNVQEHQIREWLSLVKTFMQKENNKDITPETFLIINRIHDGANEIKYNLIAQKTNETMRKIWEQVVKMFDFIKRDI